MSTKYEFAKSEPEKWLEIERIREVTCSEYNTRMLRSSEEMEKRSPLTSASVQDSKLLVLLNISRHMGRLRLSLDVNSQAQIAQKILFFFGVI